MKNPIEHLYFRAKCLPNSVAIQRLDGAITYRQLLEVVRSIAFKFRELGVRPSQVAVTCLPNRQMDWIVTLALMHEAAVTCSNHGYSEIPQELGVDWVMTDRAVGGVSEDRMVIIDKSWLKDLQQVPGDFGANAYEGTESLFRLVLTSGTTGHLKAACLSLDKVLNRCHSTTTLYFNPEEICLMALSSIGGFYVAMRKLLKGSILYHAPNLKDTIRLISQFQVECLSGSPIQLAHFIEEVRQTSLRMTSLKLVWYAGSEASPRLIEEIRQNLCTNVACWYGSTEVGGVAVFLTHDEAYQPGLAGYCVPEAEIQIVNPDHQPLVGGEEGQIRIKTPYMAMSYYLNPEETTCWFRDGWFYTGDRGKLLDNGMLVLSGRESELINRGGVKVDPAAVDRHMQGFEGVIDAAAFGFENQRGIEDICAAIVASENFDMGELQKFLIGVLGKIRAPSVMLRVNEIPRNAMGKAMRGQLREKFGERLKGRLNQQEDPNQKPTISS